MKIRLLTDIPCEAKHKLLKGRELHILRFDKNAKNMTVKKDPKDPNKRPVWVRGDNRQEVMLWPIEYEVVQ